MLNRGIDHLVLCAHDLDAARDWYARLGFTLTPKAEHPFGTANSLIQFDGAFLELLTVNDASRIVEPEDRGFSFGAFNRDYLEGGEGFSMLVFEGFDARSDQEEFAEKGLSDLEPFDFERKAKLPDGAEVTVGFSLAFVTHPDMERAVFFTCQQHAPEYFWKRDFQVHDNGALGIRDVTLVAQHPVDLFGFFAGLQDATSVFKSGEDLRIRTARGNVLVTTPAGWRKHFQSTTGPDLDHGPILAAYTICVHDLRDTEKILKNNGIPFRMLNETIVVDPTNNFGVTLEFVHDL